MASEGLINIAGGCCGTTPEHIASLVAATKNMKPVPVMQERKRVLASERQIQEIDINGPFLVIGERINPTGKKELQESLRQGSMEIVCDMAEEQEEMGAHILDINMGCPVPKVVNNGEGSALLKNPDLIVKIVKSISSAIQKPLTVKVRIGFENEPVDIVEIAKRVEDAGAAAIAVHGRTRQQYYSGIADWETIAKVKEAVSIPVIGNGDVDSPKKAEKLFRQTGCDAVMIGRAVEGNPWIFREMNHYFATGEELARPSLAEVKAMILKHARAQIEMKGEFIGIREMRKHVAWYTAGMPHSAGLRRESNNIESYADLEKLLERL